LRKHGSKYQKITFLHCHFLDAQLFMSIKNDFMIGLKTYSLIKTEQRCDFTF